MKRNPKPLRTSKDPQPPYTAAVIDRIAETNKHRADMLRAELSIEWKCVGCGYEVRFHAPVAAVGCFCCGGCGMTLMRPKRESGVSTEELLKDLINTVL